MPLTNRRTFLTATVFGLLAAPLVAQAQQAGKVWRIGLLFAGDPANFFPSLQGFYSGLQELGYTEGRNICVEVRAAKGRYEKLPALASELVSLKPDVLVTVAGAAAGAAKNATRTIPIVALFVADPIGAGLVGSLARPEGNVTGLSIVNPELGMKRLDLLKQVIPNVSRVAMLRNPLNPQYERDLVGIRSVATTLGVSLYLFDARRPEDIQPALQKAIAERAEALLVLADALFQSNRQAIIEFARGNRLPDVHPYRENAVQGGLMSYGLDSLSHYRRGAMYVDRILRGARPADLPIEQPTKYELVINLKTAKALGLTIPPSLRCGRIR